MKASFIFSVFCLSLLENALTDVDAFASVATSASNTDNTAAFGTTIPSLQTSLNSHKGDVDDSDNDLGDLYKNAPMNDVRKARLEKESRNGKRFASGEELTSLREDLKSLRQNLEWAKALKDDIRIESLEKAISKGESRDPSFMYTKAQNIISETKKMQDASEDEKKIVIDKWSSVATDAREFLPHLNMEGLWVGK